MVDGQMATLTELPLKTAIYSLLFQFLTNYMSTSLVFVEIGVDKARKWRTVDKFRRDSVIQLIPCLIRYDILHTDTAISCTVTDHL